jgi:hypothetical protein
VANIQKFGGQLTVNLKIDNTGSAVATNTVLTGVTVKTLTGTGPATVVSPLPIVVGQIAPQGSVTADTDPKSTCNRAENLVD